MNKKTRPPSWKKITEERRKENFVGRGEQIRVFQENFAGDIPTYMVFSVTGEGGVGKSTLMKRFQQVAEMDEIGANVVICNDRQGTPVEVMSYAAEQLAKKGFVHQAFDERRKKYRELRQQLESEVGSPHSKLDVIGQGAADIVLAGSELIPGVGRLTGKLDSQALGNVFAEVMKSAASRWTNKDDVLLVTEPDKVLSPLFVALLDQATQEQRLVLMLDVFERTGRQLSPWLLSLFNFEYGELNAWITFVLSGRDMLEQHWTEQAGNISHMRLEPFSEEETRVYLSNQGIVDEDLARQIYRDTSGLPVLVELLAGTNPKPGIPLPDISKDAVDRFLQWTPEDKRNIALLAAVPRQFSQDILVPLLGTEAAKMFEWLSEQSYIRSDTERGWFYHEKVRELMLRYQRKASTQTLSKSHSALAEYFAHLQEEMGLTAREAYHNEAWRQYETERVYHLFSAAPDKHWSQLVHAFMPALFYRWRFTRRFTNLARQVLSEMNNTSLEQAVCDLEDLFSAYEHEDYPQIVQLLAGLEPIALKNKEALVSFFTLRGETYNAMNKYFEAITDFDRAVALDDQIAWTFAIRGDTYRLMGKYDEALRDFERAIALDEKEPWSYARRGRTYYAMRKFAEALGDFDRAIMLDSNNVQAIAGRGDTYRAMGKYDEALKEYDLAISTDQKYTWAIAKRAETYRLLGKYAEALFDYDRAITVDDKYSWAIAGRAETYRLMNKFDEALKDFERAIQLDDKSAWAVGGRAKTFQQMGRLSEALAEFDHAIQLEPNYAWAIASRGETYYQLDNYAKALADAERAIALDDKYVFAISGRGKTYHAMGKYSEALAEFSRAIELDDIYAFAYKSRGVTHQAMGSFGKAIEDFNRAILLDSKYADAYANRGDTYRLMHKYSEALSDFSQAIQIDEKYIWAIARRGLTWHEAGNYTAALADYDRALELDDKYTWAIVRRGKTYQKLAKYTEALNDFKRAASINPGYAYAYASLGELSHILGQHDQALDYFSRAIQLDSEYASAFASRGEIYLGMGNYTAALADFDRAIELDGEYDWAIFQRGITWLILKNYQKSLEDTSRAIQLEPDDCSYHLGRAEAYRLMGSYDQAISDYTECVKTEEPDIAVLARRAAAYFSQGRQDEAQRDLAAALEIEPGSSDEHYDRAIALVLSGCIPDALAELEIALADH